LALDFVVRDAATAGSEVWLLYVRIYDVARGGCYYLETQRQARACSQLAADRLRTAGVACSCVTRNARRDKIVHTILAEAEALDAELIILGARNRTRLGEIILGSTSGAVARRSRRHVVLVHA
jgi:nucleotide-binding universal stress UspA family protein